MDKARRKKVTERLIIFFVALLVIGLLILFFSDVFFPFIRLEARRDFEGAKELLTTRGIVGFLTVSLIEALQMVVIFIPAEFIQLTSSMAYPWWQVLILCDLGVILGSSMIYFLVNIFRFDGDILNRKEKIEQYERVSKARSTVVFMYLLFIMPIIPFGAICYYGSGKKLPYWKYLITCATGVIPSIFTSIMMGTAVRTFIADELPLWVLILIIIAAAAILFVLLSFVLRKYFFKDETGLQKRYLFQSLARLVCRFYSLKVRWRVIGAEPVRELSGPFIYLAEHHSRLDVMALFQIAPEKLMVGVINEYLFRVPVLGRLLRASGQISKKLFYPDVPCLKKIIKTVQSGLPVAIFPEARLSTDGGPSYVDDSIAGLCLKLGVPIVLVEIRNDYFIAPKWRKTVFRAPCEVEVRRIVRPEELQNMSRDELASVIRENLSYNEFSRTISTFRSRKKAEGLHHVLYMCPHCRTLYSNRTSGNTMTCSYCGKQYEIGPDYRFTDDKIPTIYDYYRKIREIESETLHEISLDVPVDVKIFKDQVKTVRTEKGVFHIDREHVSFTSEISDLRFEYSVEGLEAIAYSVNEEFELYYKNELYYFYPPEGERDVCTRVALLFELLKGE